MSARLIGELTNWLLSPAAEGLTPAERCVLFAIAERSHESTRVMLRHRGDEEQLVERVARIAGVSRESGLKKVLRKLAARGLEVRIAVKDGKDGRPVYAFEGKSMGFRLPHFPASVAIPEKGESGDEATPSGPVDNDREPVDNSADDHGDGDKRGDARAPLPGERGPAGVPLSGQRGTRQGPTGVPARVPLSPSSPSTTYPSKEEHPSSVLSQRAELEGAPAQAAETIKEPEFDFPSACAFLLQVAPEIQAAAVARAERELGKGAPNETLRIRAAQIATKGIPA
ncbi:hypothetical protein [Actinomadura litoris]|uniref:hypothetical protein n=1 Tax=Actinomadura litoris TaxID=2678616 RepID=UPI001FA76938|nr:hypothetical protein [Actinomadura litoris]